MQARYITVITLLVAVFVAVCGCSSTVTPAPTPVPMSQYPMTVSDYYNRTATIAHVRRSASCRYRPSTRRYCSTSEWASRIVGDTDYCDYPARG